MTSVESEQFQDPREATFTSRFLKLVGGAAVLGAVVYVAYEVATGNISFEGTMGATVALSAGVPAVAIGHKIGSDSPTFGNPLENRGEV